MVMEFVIMMAVVNVMMDIQGLIVLVCFDLDKEKVLPGFQKKSVTHYDCCKIYLQYAERILNEITK